MKRKNSKWNKAKRLATISRAGGVMANTAVSSAIIASVQGPLGILCGSISGAAFEQLFEYIGENIDERQLSKSENKRVGEIYTLACEEISNRVNEGKTIRNDGFFDDSISNRSSAEEIFEGLTYVAQREYEEKKIKYYARLYANIAFDNSITKPMADKLIKLSEQLTYRQLAILSILGQYMLTRTDDNQMFKRQAYKEVSGLTNVTLANEIYEMYRMSLLSSKDFIVDSAGINPSSLSVSGYGALLFNLMDLKRFDSDPETIIIVSKIIVFLTNGHEVK